MPVYLSTATLGNSQTLLTIGGAGELMAWFYPHKDAHQHIHECLPCVYVGHPGAGTLSWAWEPRWYKEQFYVGDSNVLQTNLHADDLGLRLEFTDVLAPDDPVLMRHISVINHSPDLKPCGIYHFGDWNMGGIRTGNALTYSRGSGVLLQNHRAACLAMGGNALDLWQCAKAGREWANNALYALGDGHLHCQDLEIGDVNWAWGFSRALNPGERLERLAIFAMGRTQDEALGHLQAAKSKTFGESRAAAEKADAVWLSPGLEALKQAEAEGAPLPDDLSAAYRRSLLCLPLLCGEEGAAVAAPEFDPEFLSCGGYGYHWPRDGGEYVSGLMDAGYDGFCAPFFDWCARHQDPSGLWHQRYFLNGEPGPNWCLPPDMLQIDQVGAVLWAYGKWKKERSGTSKLESAKSAIISRERAAAIEKAALAKLRKSSSPSHAEMIRKAADYLAGRLTSRGVHGNAFDTWETFVGSFTYSNAAIYAALRVAADVLGEPHYDEAVRRVKEGVLTHFVREQDGYSYLVRGFNAVGEPDGTVDSASLGAIEPFGLLDLDDPNDLKIAEGTLRAVRERLECDWEGGRAIRRFEGDAYVGGVPACVNTLWMARCSLHVAKKLRELDRTDEANELRDHAQLYLQTVLRRATPTGLLPELMQGPTGQRWWAAPHGWAMSSFVSGALMLARQSEK